VAVLLAAAAIAGCGSSSKSSSSASTRASASSSSASSAAVGDNGLASRSADEILDATSQAINGATSVHVSGALDDAGNQITLNLHILSGQGATGTLSENGLSFKLIAVGQYVYINGSSGFWQHFGGQAAARRFEGKWLQAPATSGDFGSLSDLTDLHKLSRSLLAHQGPLTKGSTSTVNGHPVIAIVDPAKHSRLYVATTGKPYPVQISKGTTQHVDFDHFDAAVHLAPPRSAIDIGKLQHSTTE